MDPLAEAATVSQGPTEAASMVEKSAPDDAAEVTEGMQAEKADNGDPTPHQPQKDLENTGTETSDTPLRTGEEAPEAPSLVKQEEANRSPSPNRADGKGISAAPTTSFETESSQNKKPEARVVGEGQEHENGDEDEEAKPDDDENQDRLQEASHPTGQGRPTGRQLRYKFVCTPPDGYIPSELDAKTLPKAYFFDPQSDFTLRAKASHRRTADHAQAQRPGSDTGRNEDPAIKVEPTAFRPITHPRHGAIGTHLADSLVMSRRVGYGLESTREVLPLPFNCQPPKKRFRNTYGYVTGPQHFYEVRDLEPSPPSPNPLLYAAYR